MCPEDQNERSPSSRTGLRFLLLMGIALLAWCPVLLFTDWTADDPHVVLDHPVVTGTLPVSAALDRDYTHHLGDSGQWRPAAAISLRMDHALYGPDSSRGWHLTNLLLHLATVALAALLARRAHGTMLFFGVAAYALHPILADSVAWVSGRPALTCAFLGLAGAHLLQTGLSRNDRPATTFLCAAIGLGLPLLAKEDGALFSILLLVLSAKVGAAAIRRTAAGCLLAIGLWFIARASALGDALPTATHSILPGAPLHERLVVGLRGAGEAVRLLFAPLDRPPHYDLGGLPGVLISLLLIGAFAATLYLFHRRRPLPWLLVALPVLAFTPFLQVLPAGEVFAPRFAHLPLLFAIPLADHILRRFNKLIQVLVLLPLVFITWATIPTYADAESYWLATIHHSPSCHVAWNALGVARADDGRHEEAIASFRTAIELKAGHSRAWSNLARSLRATGRNEESVYALRTAVSEGPRNPIAHVNWGRHLARQGRHAEARDSFVLATRLQPGLHPAWEGLARAEASLGRTRESAEATQRARTLRPD